MSFYVKAAVTYSGSVIFGYAEDVQDRDRSTLATTILAVMVKCLFTGKRFLATLSHAIV